MCTIDIRAYYLLYVQFHLEGVVDLLFRGPRNVTSKF